MMRPSPVVTRRLIPCYSQEELRGHTDSTPESTQFYEWEGERRGEHPLPQPDPTHDGCLSGLFVGVVGRGFE